ncbi:hypothetical protein ODZ84_09850 [Chryseobacterium fluminis]|uniref:hypothetical protein n=1 Tax=Chryseobacterium fluminis TaxID=2983606 RepID=UPI002253F6DD|nr:hypothetical protein [Chryseobacterium sp. MMS21-Ot14]UZT99836.1 hypothetical protein ODZ84_09850 [Chryseobacterium sp. MMS21-Ot14]
MAINFFKILFFLSFISLYSCQNSRNTDIDSVISKYDNHNFSLFKGSFIAIRQEYPTEIIYIIGDLEGNKPLYFVHYNAVQNSITKINNSLLQKYNMDDYFDKEKINKLIINFRKYNFKLLSVDENDNVFINPFEINSPAILLKVPKASGVERIRMGYFYKKYKANWYIIE